MLNEIRKLFRKSVEAFRAELGTKEPEDQVAELLSAMRRELVAVRAATPEFEAILTRARADLAREREGLALCERRGAMAERIGDRETAQVAKDFASRHRERILVLEQKVVAAEAELTLHRREAEEMTRRYQDADMNRFALLAQVRRAAANERRRSGAAADAGLFAELERMEDQLGRDAAYVEALGELEDSPPPPAAAPSDRAVLEERLRELKKRMGRGE